MAELTKDEMLKIVNENIKKLEDKNFNVYFFVLDTKGNPSGSIEYLYKTALTLKNLGYKVTMIHQEKEFIGPFEWLGDEYSDIPHKNVEDENVEISPADFLFIPEIFTNVMTQTKTLPCKRVIVLQNYNFLCEFMPVGVTPKDLNISDIITTTYSQEEIVKTYFPGIRTQVVRPSINKMFREPIDPQKLIINVVSKEQTDVNRILKPFYWKYPVYKWVSFRDLRGLSQEAFCEALREGAITVWMDDTTNFGYAALEALRCGTLLIAKIPEHLTDWNVEKSKNEETDITDACVWFDDIDKVPEILASVVRTWTLDKIPADVYERQRKFNDQYTSELQEADIKTAYVQNLFEKRLNEFKEVKGQINDNKFKTGK